MIDRILDALTDGEWHSFPWICMRVNAKSDLDRRKLSIFLEFLTKYKFLATDEDATVGQIKMHCQAWKVVPKVQEFLMALKQLEAGELSAEDLATLHWPTNE